MVTIHTINIRGVSIAYDERGDASKQPVIFIHGSASDYRTWEAQMDVFAQKYHVFAYSRRAHYPNPYVEYRSDYTIKVETDDLAALIQRLTVNPVHLVGWSYGAFIAASVAKNYSQLVRSLVLAEPPIMSFLTINPETAPLLKDMAATVSAVRGALNAGNYREAVQRFIDAVNGQGAFRFSPPEQQKRMLQNAKTLFELTSVERDPFGCNDAMAIDAPTLLVSGEKSGLLLHKITSELARCLSRKECVVIKNAGHGMHIQNPQEYNSAVLGFLEAN
ncbi:MAG TPA: alpha/beta hydrolase [Candidatus Limnocylindrales bacterium]|nr:alpha/beta hydrolase [Candidatus Limnocylindrales bacterium]